MTSTGSGRGHRVLHIVLSLHQGGLERLVVDLVSRADPGRTNPAVLCLKRAGRLADELPPARLHLIPEIERHHLLLPLGLSRRIRHHRPHLVHLHSGVLLKGAYAARLAGVRRVVFTDHGRAHPDPWRNRLADRAGSSFTDAIVAVSPALADYLRQRLRIPRHKIRHIPNGIRIPADGHPPARPRIRAELGLSPTTPLVGGVGRFDPVKRFDLLIEAVGHIHRRTPNPTHRPALLLAGDGPTRRDLEARAAACGLTSATHFLGWRKDVSDLLPELDVFALPSDSEGTSLSLLEAMAAGRAVVATAVGGTPAVVGPQLTGQLVPPGNALALADRIQDMLADPARRHQAGQTARRQVAAHNSLDTMVQGYQNLYDQLLG